MIHIPDELFKLKTCSNNDSHSLGSENRLQFGPSPQKPIVYNYSEKRQSPPYSTPFSEVYCEPV
jgi:hypothetical protein